MNLWAICEIHYQFIFMNPVFTGTVNFSIKTNVFSFVFFWNAIIVAYVLNPPEDFYVMLNCCAISVCFMGKKGSILAIFTKRLYFARFQFQWDCCERSFLKLLIFSKSFIKYIWEFTLEGKKWIIPCQLIYILYFSLLCSMQYHVDKYRVARMCWDRGPFH